MSAFQRYMISELYNLEAVIFRICAVLLVLSSIIRQSIIEFCCNFVAEKPSNLYVVNISILFGNSARLL